jgi:hypothetical protein
LVNSIEDAGLRYVTYRALLFDNPMRLVGRLAFAYYIGNSPGMRALDLKGEVYVA